MSNGHAGGKCWEGAFRGLGTRRPLSPSAVAWYAHEARIPSNGTPAQVGGLAPPQEVLLNCRLNASPCC
jgi:hypothetical protein